MLHPFQLERLFFGRHDYRRKAPKGTKWSTALRHDPCSYCGLRSARKVSKKERRKGLSFPDMMTLDHILPRPESRGWDNQTGSCRACNEQKSDTPLLLFLLERRLVLAEATCPRNRHNPIGSSR